MEPLTIAAHNGAPVWGGAEIALVRILAGLSRRGHEVRLYANHPEVVDRARDLGTPAQRLHLGGDVAVHHAVRFALELRHSRPDVLLLGTFRKTWLGALAGRLAGVPRVVARIGLETDMPRNVKYRLVFRHWIDAVAFNADGMRRDFVAALPAVAGRAVTIYTGLPAGRPEGGRGFRLDLGIPEDAWLVGSVGRLVAQKRYDRFVRALAALPDVHGVIVGDGAARGELDRLARATEVADRIHFAGHMDDVGPALDAMDVFVVSSDREGMSNAMLEALAAGVPVVSTAVSGAREALRGGPDGEPGAVVDPTPVALAAALRKLLDAPDRLEAMGRAARAVARSRFGEDRMLDEWESLLRGA